MEMTGMSEASALRSGVETVKDPGQLVRALDEQAQVLDQLEEEVSLLRRTLLPLTQDSVTPDRPEIMADPQPPASELTRRVRSHAEALAGLRDRLMETRAYLDLN